jgi:hypothetical protein
LVKAAKFHLNQIMPVLDASAWVNHTNRDAALLRILFPGKIIPRELEHQG